MDLTGIFAWLNDFSAWIGGFFSWLLMWVKALIGVVVVMAHDFFYRATFWLLKLFFTGLAAVAPPSVNFGQSLEALSASGVDFLLAANIPQAIATVFGVVVFKFIVTIR